MLTLNFSGWAMCRLATDPDPYDEPRGVSGYMRAWAGEPDLDRIIRFQSPPFQRTHTHQIGVTVKTVIVDGVADASHSLLGAEVNLLDDPVFEGRNGVIAEDGLEPIYPVHMSIKSGRGQFSREIVPDDPERPYRQFNGQMYSANGQIEQETGITSMIPIWQQRLGLVEQELASSSNEGRPGIEERISFLRREIARGPEGLASFFGFAMIWSLELTSDIRSDSDLAELLDGYEASEEAWRTQFWIGGWDVDAQSFFVSGRLEIDRSGAETRLGTVRQRQLA